MDQFILFGDSIVQQSFSQERGFGFGAALSDAFVRRLDVVNRGFSGYNTRQALQVLPHAIPRPEHANVRFMIVFFGANDARLPDTPHPPQQHVPLAEYKQNLRAIVTSSHVHAHADIRIVLITPPALDERKCLEIEQKFSPKKLRVPSRRAAVTAAYAQAVRDLGAELGLEVVDLFAAMIRRAGGISNLTDQSSGPEIIGSAEQPRNETLQSFLRDGLHPTPSGYRIIFEETMAVLRRAYPDQDPDKLSYVVPAWDDPEAWK